MPSVVPCLENPSIYGLVICNPDGSPISAGSGSGPGPGSGATSFLEKQTADGTSPWIVFKNSITPAVEAYIIDFYAIDGGNAADNLCIQFSSDGGVTWDQGTPNYWSIASFTQLTGGSGGARTTATFAYNTQPGVMIYVNFTGTATGSVRVLNPNGGNSNSSIAGKFSNFEPGSPTVMQGCDLVAGYSHTTPYNAFRIGLMYGNKLNAGGYAKCYGISG